ERPRRRQLVDRGCPCLEILRLLLRTLDREAGVGHPAPDPGRRLADAHLRLGRRVLRLDDLLLRPEPLDPRLELLLACDELLLLVGEPLDLLVEPLKLLLGGRLALERLAGEVLAVRGDRLPGLRL